MTKDEKTGRGKPPKHTQFKKGQSGNPKGRPKGSKNKGSIIQEIIDRKITVRENGKERKIPVFEAAVEKMIATGLNGSMNDLVKLVQLIEKYAPDKLANKSENIPHTVTVEFVKSDGNGRPADRSKWKPWQWESYRREHDNDPEVVAAWKASGLADDDEIDEEAESDDLSFLD